MRVTGTDQWRRIEPPRPVNEWERRALTIILSAPFDGHEHLKAQIANARVFEESPTDPSVMLCVDPTAPRAIASDGRPWSGVVPIELGGHAVDGVPIWALLDVRDGYLYFLDVQRADGAPLPVPPELADMELQRL